MTMLQHGLVPSTGGYQIERSLRFNSADSATLTRTPGSSGNRKTWTTSFWVKRTALGYKNLLNCSQSIGSSNDQLFQLAFNSSDKLYIFQYNPSTIQMDLQTTAVYRDVSAWYHIVLAYDTTQATASDRVKLYVNGVQVTSFSSATYPSQNSDGYINNTIPHVFGQYAGGSGGIYLDAYIADFHLVDGSALTPSSFGENDTDTGVWKPKAYTGSYGTNGFKLTFSDNSGTTSTTLGKDTSGNSNNWTPNNFSVTAGAGNDSLVDTPTPYGTDTGAGGQVRGNYATLNPLVKTDSGSPNTLSDGNLRANCTSGSYGDTSFATIPVSSGKWYAEFTLSSSAYPSIEIFNMNFPPNFGFSGNGRASLSPYGYGYLYTGNKQNNASASSYGSTFTTGDVIGIALDMDNGKVFFSKNGTWQASGDPAAGTNAAFTGLSGNFAICVCDSQSGSFSYANFGQRPFAYTAPSGFKALCTTNLPTPTIGATSSTRADDYFNTVLYTGTGSSLGVTGVGFQPDFVWIKSRSAATDHGLYDAVRGVQKQLESNNTGAETTETTGLTAFNTDGFTVGALAQLNTNTATYVGWNWKANGAGSSNTAGSITSTVSANTTADFSVVTYTGNGTAGATVGHGIGVAPSMIIIKKRNNSDTDWVVYHSSLGNGNAISLNLTSASFSYTGWNSTTPGSSVFTLGSNNGVNNNTSTYVAYCFAPVAGYSAFGSYTGNGSTDGPMIFTGFRPRYLLVKASSGTSAGAQNWEVRDSARAPYNDGNRIILRPSSSDAEVVDAFPIDFTSNGFKVRNTGAGSNESGTTYIYAAFAEAPFKYALAR